LIKWINNILWEEKSSF